MVDNSRVKGNQYRKLGKDTLIFAISNFSSKILVFLLLPLYTSCLTTEEYGIVDLINNLVNILFPILTLSIIEGILRFSFEKDVSRSEIVSIAVFSYLSSSVLLCAATPIAFLIGGTIWKHWLWILLVFNGYCLSSTLSYYLRGINEARYVAIQGVVQTVLTVVGNIVVLVVLKKGMQGYIFSLITSYYATAFFIIIFTKVYKDFKTFAINKRLFKEMMSYCVPMIPSKVAWWMNNSLDKYYIIFFCGIGTSGVYSVAHKIPSILSVFTEIFNQAWQISAIEIYTASNDDHTMYSKVHLYYIYFSILCASFLILLSKLLGKMLFANDFFVAWKYVPILIVAAVFASLSGFYHSIFRAAKMSKQLAITVVAGTGVNILLNTILVPLFDAYGAAVATVIGFLVEWIISYRYTLRIVDLSINPKKIIFLFCCLGLECLITILSVNNSLFIIVDIILIIVIIIITKNELYEIANKILYLINKRITTRKPANKKSSGK